MIGGRRYERSIQPVRNRILVDPERLNIRLPDKRWRLRNVSVSRLKRRKRVRVLGCRPWIREPVDEWPARNANHISGFLAGMHAFRCPRFIDTEKSEWV